MRTFLLLVMMLFVFGAKAQQSELLANTWLLQSMLVDDVEYTFPNSAEITESKLTFSETGFASTFCNTLDAASTFSDTTIFVSGFTLTLGSCPNNDLDEFEEYYFGDFYGTSTMNGFYDRFSYTIENTNNTKYLTLVNPNGDKATFVAQSLSVSEIVTDGAKVFPNPAKEDITVMGKTMSSIRILDAQGKVVLTENNIAFDEVKLNISTLPKGFYLVSIQEENGKTKTVKIIKQ